MKASPYSTEVPLNVPLQAACALRLCDAVGCVLQCGHSLDK